MNAKSFWVYSIWSFCFAITFGLTFNYCVAPAYIYNNADYDMQVEAHDQLQKKLHDANKNYENWKENGKKAIRQRQLEEVVAGLRPHEVLHGTELEGIAYALYIIGKTGTDTRQRAEAVTALFTSPEHNALAPYWMKCDNAQNNNQWTNCKFVDELSVLNEPARLALLFAGDTKGLAVSDFLSTDEEKFKTTFAKLKSATEAAKKDLRPPTLERPSWISYVDWLIFSFTFAIAFGLIGYAYWANSESYHGFQWSHPLRTFPGFAFGWLFMLLTLPGFIFVHLMRLMTLNTGPALSWLKEQFVQSSFDDDYGKVAKQLQELKKSAQSLGDNKLLEKIEEQMSKAKIGQSRTQLAKLRDAIAQIEVLDTQFQGMEEIERELR